MHRVEPFLDPQQVEPRTSSDHHAERLLPNLPTEGQLLQAVEASRPLDMGLGLRALHLGPFEHLPQHQRLAEHAHGFIQVVPDAAIQPNQLAVDVVEYFRPRQAGAHEQRSGAAGECLRVAVELREVRIKAFQQAAVAASR